MTCRLDASDTRLTLCREHNRSILDCVKVAEGLASRRDEPAGPGAKILAALKEYARKQQDEFTGTTDQRSWAAWQRVIDLAGDAEAALTTRRADSGGPTDVSRGSVLCEGNPGSHDPDATSTVRASHSGLAPAIDEIASDMEDGESATVRAIALKQAQTIAINCPLEHWRDGWKPCLNCIAAALTQGAGERAGVTGQAIYEAMASMVPAAPTRVWTEVEQRTRDYYNEVARRALTPPAGPRGSTA